MSSHVPQHVKLVVNCNTGEPDKLNIGITDPPNGQIYFEIDYKVEGNRPHVIVVNDDDIGKIIDTLIEIRTNKFLIE